jgi:hypothetical protein
MIKETVRFMDKAISKVGKAFQSKVLMANNVTLILRDGDGNIKDAREIHNTVPNVGLYGVMDQLLASPTEAKPGWMEVGTSTPSATKLGAYISGSKTALSAKTRTNAVVEMKCTFAAGVGTGAITEAGIFNSVTEDSGTMYVSASFGVITKAAADSLEIIWTMTAAAA